MPYKVIDATEIANHSSARPGTSKSENLESALNHLERRGWKLAHVVENGGPTGGSPTQFVFYAKSEPQRASDSRPAPEITAVTLDSV